MVESGEIESLESLDEFIEQQDNSESFVYLSKIPEICKTEKCVLGR
jgi:ribonuclease H2 subunit A